MSWKETLIKKILPYLVPSTWVELVNGNKLYLSLVMFSLYAVIYGIPQFCVTATCAVIASIGLQIQSILIDAGFDLQSGLIDIASILAITGIGDKLIDHNLTKVVLGILRSIEEPIAKLIEKGKDIEELKEEEK